MEPRQKAQVLNYRGVRLPGGRLVRNSPSGIQSIQVPNEECAQDWFLARVTVTCKCRAYPTQARASGSREQPCCESQSAPTTLFAVISLRAFSPERGLHQQEKTKLRPPPRCAMVPRDPVCPSLPAQLCPIRRFPRVGASLRLRPLKPAPFPRLSQVTSGMAGMEQNDYH